MTKSRLLFVALSLLTLLGTAAKQREPFFTTELSKETAYVGEPVVYSVVFHTPTSDIEYVKPMSGTDFGNCDTRVTVGTAQAHFVDHENVDNEPWLKAIVFQAVLYPTKAGTITLPAQDYAVGEAYYETAYDPFWGPIGQRMVEEKTYSSEKRKLKVNKLPTPIAENFTNAIGDFHIELATPRQTVERNKEFQVVYVIEGYGSLEELKFPDLKALYPSDLKVVSCRLEEDGVIDGDRLVSRVEYIVSIVPSTAGKHEIPDIDFVEFNPQLNQYVTITAKGAEIEVSPQKSGSQTGSEIFI